MSFFQKCVYIFIELLHTFLEGIIGETICIHAYFMQLSDKQFAAIQINIDLLGH